MTDKELKSAAIERLRSLGLDIPDNAGFGVLSEAIGTLGAKRDHHNTGREDHVRAWMAPQRPEPYVRPFRALDVAKQFARWRMADIAAGQPPFMTPRGAAGNGSEHSKVWRR